MDTDKKQASGDFRSEVMRARLLDATLAVIMQEGWSGASTPKICKQAEVSRGAQTHHFPTKTSLFMAAIERLARQSEAHVLQSMADLGDDQKSLRTVLKLLWEAMLNDTYMQSSMEAMVAARTDTELRGSIGALDKEAIESIRSLADGLAASPESLERVKDALELSIYLFRGLVIQRGMHDDEKFRGRLFDVWCDLIEKALESDIQPG
jgi:AcrR family transcriptional regulator